MPFPASRVLGSCLCLVLLAAGSQTAAGVARGASPHQRPVSPSDKPRSAGRLNKARAPAAMGVLVSFAARISSEARTSVEASVDALDSRRLPGTHVFLFRLPAGASPVAAAAEISRRPGVARAEPNWLARTTETIPNDPRLARQWGLRNTGQSHPVYDPPPGSFSGTAGADGQVTLAWDTTQGTADAVVAVIDTGVTVAHPDLSANLWVNPGEIADNSIDDDDNGYVDDVNGWDFYSGDNVPQDTNGHGTHVAGIVAAVADNAIGGAGVCPGCRIMALRAGGAGGSLPLSGIIEATVYAAHNGADIINMSFGGHVWSGFQRNSIAAAGAQGVLVVASAGNDAADNDYLAWDGSSPIGPNYPASFDLANLVSVAASNDADFYGYLTGCYERTGSAGCLFTNWGRTSVDLAAPGVDIDSTWLSNGYRVVAGTSMASPFVAGVAGLVKSVHPTYSPMELKNAILNSVDHPNGLKGRFMVTDGRVDAAAALSASTAEATPVTDGTMRGATAFEGRKFGSLAFPGDINDVYRRYLVKGRRYAASLHVPKGKDFDLFVWKPGTIDTWPISYGCGGISCQLKKAGLKSRGKDEQVAFTTSTTGVYYFHVTTSAGRGGYTLRVSSLSSRH